MFTDKYDQQAHSNGILRNVEQTTVCFVRRRYRIISLFSFFSLFFCFGRSPFVYFF